MKRLAAAAVLALFCLSVTAAFAAEKEKQAPPKPPPYTGLKKRIGVLPILVGGGSVSSTRGNIGGSDVNLTTTWNSDRSPGEVGTALTEQLTTALINTGRFIVLERAALNDVLAEQDLGASGRVNKETAAAKGNLTGAEWLVKAAITEYTDKKSRSGGGIRIGGVALGGAKREAFVALDVRIIDATTGQVVDSVKADGRARSSGALGGVAFGNVALAAGKEDTTPIGQATRAALVDAIDFICQRMDKVPWQSRVIKAEGKQVTISGGSNMNIKVGDTFAVLHRGEALIDPDTGENLGSEESRLGAMKITKVAERYSVGTMIEGKAPVRGDAVRVNLAAGAAE